MTLQLWPQCGAWSWVGQECGQWALCHHRLPVWTHWALPSAPSYKGQGGHWTWARRASTVQPQWPRGEGSAGAGEGLGTSAPPPQPAQTLSPEPEPAGLPSCPRSVLTRAAAMAAPSSLPRWLLPPRAAWRGVVSRNLPVKSRAATAWPRVLRGSLRLSGCSGWPWPAFPWSSSRCHCGPPGSDWVPPSASGVPPGPERQGCPRSLP